MDESGVGIRAGFGDALSGIIYFTSAFVSQRHRAGKLVLTSNITHCMLSFSKRVLFSTHDPKRLCRSNFFPTLGQKTSCLSLLPGRLHKPPYD
ncbi:hypothetical protein YC2023_038101 [Brassica napus]